MKRIFSPFLFYFFFFECAWGAGFIDNVSGTPFRWAQATPAVSYFLDKGDVSSSILHAEGRTLVDAAFARWGNVSTSWLTSASFADAGDDANDIDGTNWTDYISISADGSALQVLKDYSIIIFDKNGAIFTQLFGGSATLVLGLASPGGYDAGTVTITKGFALINGAAQGISSASIAATLTHELGHLLNLAHVQLNWEEAFDSDLSNDSVIPTMFPYIPSDESVLLTLERDDEFSLSYLYPHPTNYAAKGSVTGQILRRDGSGVLGANVNCRNQANSREDAVSWISDMVLAGNGEYLCGNLEAGSYTVDIEPVVFAINVYDPDPAMVATEFYNGSNESFDPEIDSRTESTAVSVSDGGATTDIHVTLNEDGRLTSGQKVTGSFGDYSWLQYGYSEIEYLFTVPSGARSVKFDLEATNSSVDIDLVGRCDQEFALTGDAGAGTSIPVYDLDASVAQQAEFQGTTEASTESVTLNSTSTPALRACTYHLLVINASAASTSFELTATVEGASPKFSITRGSGDVVSDGSGEILVMSRKLSAEGDTFYVKSLTVTDNGTGDFYRVERVTLYADTNGDGAVSDDDRVVASKTDIDREGRIIAFSGLREFIVPGTPQTYLVTYNVSAAAGAGGWLAVFLLGLVLSQFYAPLRRRALVLLLLVFLTATCGEKVSGYDATISGSSSVSVKGLAFGDSIAISVRDGAPSSVKNFFD